MSEYRFEIELPWDLFGDWTPGEGEIHLYSAVTGRCEYKVYIPDPNSLSSAITAIRSAGYVIEGAWQKLDI